MAERNALPPDARARLIAHVEGSIDAKRALLTDAADAVLAAASLMIEALGAGNKALFCGNGGSAADCQHIATELVSSLRHDFARPALAAIALTTDSSLLTAYSNDFGFAGVFRRQVEALGRPGDVLIGVSTSGGSENVVQAMEAARGAGLRTIALTGAGGGRLAALADVAVRVPAQDTQHVQEAHIMIGHVLCDLVERALYPVPDGG